jgi:hypothetical protein
MYCTGLLCFAGHGSFNASHKYDTKGPQLNLTGTFKKNSSFSLIELMVGSCVFLGYLAITWMAKSGPFLYLLFLELKKIAFLHSFLRYNKTT